MEKSTNDFFDRALIKLKRKYGKDELVSSLLKKIKEQEVEIGKLKSEVDFLNNELKISDEKKEISRLAKLESKKNELYLIQIEQNKNLRQKVRSLTHQRNDLVAKVYELENKKQ